MFRPFSLLQLLVVFSFVGRSAAAEPAEPPAAPEPGAFSRVLRESEFVKPGIMKAASEAAHAGAKKEPVLPGDFERHASLVLVADKLAADFPDMFASIIAEAHAEIELVGLVSDAPGRDVVRKTLARYSLPANGIRLVDVPTDTVWVRDFGPVFVSGAGERALSAFDFDYRRRSGSKDRTSDDAAGSLIARRLGIEVHRAPFELEAGNLLSNGRGVLVTTTDTFNANISRGYDAQAILRYLDENLGCATVVLLEPLEHEPTGHVDVFACFTAPDTIVVGQYAAAVDPANAGVLDRNAATLSKAGDGAAKLRMVRTAMPDNGDGVCRSYTNAVFANGVVLVPRFGGADAKADQEALDTYRRLLPGRKVVGIDANRIVRREGALRCITLAVPAGRE